MNHSRKAHDGVTVTDIPHGKHVVCRTRIASGKFLKMISFMAGEDMKHSQRLKQEYAFSLFGEGYSFSFVLKKGFKRVHMDTMVKAVELIDGKLRKSATPKQGRKTP